MCGSNDIELDPTASAAALSDALRGDAVFDIRSESDRLVRSGKLVGLDGDRLIIETESAETPARRRSGGGLTVEFELRGDTYRFSATESACRRNGATERVAVNRTSPVRVRQRRRFWRTSVRPSCRAALSTPGGRRIGNGTVLNVSRDGMACRIPTVVGNRMNVDSHVRVEFVLEGDSDPFKVDSILRAVTPASDPTEVVLRLQFDWRDSDGEADRVERLTRMEPATAL